MILNLYKTFALPGVLLLAVTALALPERGHASADDTVTNAINAALAATATIAIQNDAASTAAVAPDPTPIGPDLQVHYDAGVSAEVQRQFVQQLTEQDAAAGRAMQGDFDRMDVLSELDRRLSAYGFSINDMADAMTAYWIVLWQSVHDAPDPPQDQIQMVRAQVGGVLAAHPTLAQSDAQTRQKLTEWMLYLLAYIANSHQQFKAAGDQAQLAKLQDEVHRGMLKDGLDLRRIELTAEGFRPLE